MSPELSRLTPAIANESLQSILAETGIELLRGSFRFRCQVFPAFQRIRSPPVGQIGIAARSAVAHGCHVDRLLESVRKHPLFIGAPRPGDHLRGDIAPIDDGKLTHEPSIFGVERGSYAPG